MKIKHWQFSKKTFVPDAIKSLGKSKRDHSRGGARNFPTGGDSFDEGAKIWFSGYYKCQKSPKKLLSPSDEVASMLRQGGYTPSPPLVPPLDHSTLTLGF